MGTGSLGVYGPSCPPRFASPRSSRGVVSRVPSLGTSPLDHGKAPMVGDFTP